MGEMNLREMEKGGESLILTYSSAMITDLVEGNRFSMFCRKAKYETGRGFDVRRRIRTGAFRCASLNDSALVWELISRDRASSPNQRMEGSMRVV